MNAPLLNRAYFLRILGFLCLGLSLLSCAARDTGSGIGRPQLSLDEPSLSSDTIRIHVRSSQAGSILWLLYEGTHLAPLSQDAFLEDYQASTSTRHTLLHQGEQALGSYDAASLFYTLQLDLPQLDAGRYSLYALGQMSPAHYSSSSLLSFCKPPPESPEDSEDSEDSNDESQPCHRAAPPFSWGNQAFCLANPSLPGCVRFASSEPPTATPDTSTVAWTCANGVAMSGSSAIATERCVSCNAGYLRDPVGQQCHAIRDTDRDGIPNHEDLDDDGDGTPDDMDVDDDNDGLIEIHDIDMLHNIRYSPEGSSYQTADTTFTQGSYRRGLCSNSALLTQDACTAASGAWRYFGCSDGMQLSQSACTTSDGNWLGEMCTDSLHSTQAACEEASETWHSIPQIALESALANCDYVASTSHFLCGYELDRGLDFALETSYAPGSTFWRTQIFRPLNVEAIPEDTEVPLTLVAENPSMAGNAGWEPIGSTESPFGGILDGNGYMLRNLYMRSLSDETRADGLALFGVASRVHIRNFSIEEAYVRGVRNVGGFVGECKGNLNITASRFTGAVSGSDNVGGFAGRTQAQVDIVASSSISTVSGTINTGGLVGESGASLSITALSFDGTVSGNFNTGGLVGESGGSLSITTGRFGGTVSGTTNTGGLVGESGG